MFSMIFSSLCATRDYPVGQRRYQLVESIHHFAFPVVRQTQGPAAAFQALGLNQCNERGAHQIHGHS